MKRLTNAERRAISDAARALRAIPSSSRSSASRRNGALGGRPTSGLASDREVRRRARAWFMDRACAQYITLHTSRIQSILGISACITSRDFARYCAVIRTDCLIYCPDRPCIRYVLERYRDIQHILLLSPVLL